MKKVIIMSAVLVLGSANLAFPQYGSLNKVRMHYEIPDANSVYMPLEGYSTSPRYAHSDSDIFTTQVNVNENGDNIIGDAANEPSIAIDPNNPNRIMIGWRQFDNVNSSFRQAGYAFSPDAGKSWTPSGVIDPGVFRSDPVLACDAEGNFYYNSLSVDGFDFFCNVFKTSGDGIEWDEGTFARGGDKQWMCIDNSNGEGRGNIYSNWSKDFSYCYPAFFTRSTNAGMSFEDCIPVVGMPRWGTECIGPEGELYIVGEGEHIDIIVVRSDNARQRGSSIDWSVFTSVNLHGQLGGWKSVNPQGLLGQVWIDCDRSDGPGRGNVYVCASIDLLCNADEGDVMFARSRDGGLTFEPAVRINNDLSMNNIQWFSTMSVAPNGRIDIVWLDTRVDPDGNYKSALFYSYSPDQGVSWSDNKQVSPIFDPHLGWPVQKKMGDYFDMVSDEGGAHLAWANTLNGEQDVYYSYIKPGELGMADHQYVTRFGITSFPNPCSGLAYIQYTLKESVHVRLVVYDMLGHIIEVLVDEYQTKGTHTTLFQSEYLHDGIYIASLDVYGQKMRCKMVKASGGH